MDTCAVIAVHLLFHDLERLDPLHCSMVGDGIRREGIPHGLSPSPVPSVYCMARRRIGHGVEPPSLLGHEAEPVFDGYRYVDGR